MRPFLETDRLSDSERSMPMGGACAKAYRWSPKMDLVRRHRRAGHNAGGIDDRQGNWHISAYDASD